MDIIGSKPAMGFSINEDFAKKYEEKKRREELSKRKSDRCGDRGRRNTNNSPTPNEPDIQY